MGFVSLDNEGMQFFKLSIIICLVLSSTLALGKSKPTLVKIGGYEFSPFVEKEGKEGLVKDLIYKLNSSQEKYRFEFVLTSANRRYRDFKTQKFDIILFEDEAWSWKKSGIHYDRTPVLGSGSELVIALNNEGRDQKYFDNLENKKVEVVLGYHYQLNNMNTETDNLMAKGIIQGKSNIDNLSDLLAKKVDITYVNSLMLSRYLNKNKELKDKLLIGQKKDHHFSLRGLIHPNSPIKVSELEKLGFNKILISEDL
jgi:ABC-type amino acid transport substrate-binding protein